MELTPIYRIEYFLDAIVNGSVCPYEPIYRVEYYLARLAGADVTIPEPIYRVEFYLAKLCGMDVEIPDPIYRIEFYLAKACGMDVEVPEPIYRVEYWLYEMAGGGTDTYTTFTGSLIQFTAPKAHAFKSFSFTVDPVQDLHGQSAPYPAGGGKNKYPVMVGRDAFADLFSATHTTDNDTLSVTMASTTNSGVYSIPTSSFYSLSSALSGSYVCSFDIKGSVSGYVRIGYEGGVGRSDIAVTTSWQRVSIPLTFSATGKAFDVYNISGSDMTVDIKNLQIESGETATAYAPYSNICPISGWNSANLYRTAEYDPTASPSLTLNFNDTIYGGNAVWNGDGTWTVTVDRASKNMEVSEGAITIGTTSFGLKYADIYYSSTGTPLYNNAPILTSEYKHISSTAVGQDGTIKTYSSAFTIYDNRFTDKATAKSILDNVQLVYPLATPQTVTVTTAELFNALKGENNIWTDCGDTTLEAIGEAIELNALQSLNILLGGRYVNNHTADDVSDEEALNILLGGNDR